MASSRTASSCSRELGRLRSHSTDPVLESNAPKHDVSSCSSEETQTERSRSQSRSEMSLFKFMPRIWRQRRRKDSQLPSNICGFTNLGNTCYLNSALQCLIATRLLSEYINRDMYVKDLANRLHSESRGILLKTYSKVVKKVFSGTVAPEGVKLHELKSAVSSAHPMFSGYEQHDAQEFLAVFLDGIHEELNRAGDHQAYSDPDIHSEELALHGEERLAAFAWQRYLRRNKSFLVDLFQGQLESRITCSCCGEISVKYEPFLYLSLPVQSNTLTLEKALSLFSDPEIINDPVYLCHRCQEPVPISKRLKLVKLPPVLIIHFKRFEFSFHQGRKIVSLVKSPLQGLSLERVVSQKEAPVYDLYGVINHFGQVEYGHYVAICLRDGVWYRFDDSSVSVIDEPDVISESNYVLFYQRRDVPIEPHMLRRQTLTRPEDWPHHLSRQSIEILRNIQDKTYS